MKRPTTAEHQQLLERFNRLNDAHMRLIEEVKSLRMEQSVRIDNIEREAMLAHELKSHHAKENAYRSLLWDLLTLKDE